MAHALTRVSNEVQSRDWLEFIFNKKLGDLSRPSYKDVLRIATAQWDVLDYADLWDAFGSFCYAVATLAKADVIDSWKDVGDALRYIRYMITPTEFDTCPLECLIYKDVEVREQFAWFLYKAAGCGQDMANLYRYMYQLDSDTAKHVYATSAQYIWDAPMERECTMTEFCRVFNPYKYSVNVTVGSYTSHVEPLLDKIQADSAWVYERGGKEYDFESSLGLDPCDIRKEDVPEDLFDDWCVAVNHWRAAVDCMLCPSGEKYGTGARTYREFCKRACPIDADRISFCALKFADAVDNIFNWWYRLNCKPQCVEHAGGFVLGTMEESDLMRSWLE